MYLLEVIATTGFSLLARIYPEWGGRAEDASTAGFSHKPVSQAGSGPGFPPTDWERLTHGGRLQAGPRAALPLSAGLACLSRWPSLPSTSGQTPSCWRRCYGVAAGRAVSSPVDSFPSPIWPFRGVFPRGLTLRPGCSSLDPLGNSLWVPQPHGIRRIYGNFWLPFLWASRLGAG